MDTIRALLFCTPSPSKKSLFRGIFRLLAHEYLFELFLHSCSSCRFSTIYSKNPISTDSEIVCEMSMMAHLSED